MIVRQLFLAVVIIALFGACKSRSNGKGRLEITVEVAAGPGETAPDMEKINTALKSRLVNIGFEEEDVTGTVSGNRIKLALGHFSAYPEIDRQRIRRVLQAGGHLELSETYEAAEIIVLLQQAEEALTDSLYGTAGDTITEQPAGETAHHPIFELLVPNISQGMNGPQLLPGPEIGRVALRDTAAFNALLNLPVIKNKLPSALRLAWAKDIIRSNEHGGPETAKLIALKNTDAGKARMNNPGVTSSEVSRDQNNHGFVISVSLDQPSGDNFARMTGENDRKAIAIVVDDIVYSYPSVMGAITGGKFEITGNFSEAEANDLERLLRVGNGTGGTRIRIMQEDLIQ